MGRGSYLAAAGAAWRGKGLLNGTWSTVSLCLQLSICKGLHKWLYELTLIHMCMHSHVHIRHRTNSPVHAFTCTCSPSPLTLVCSSMDLCPVHVHSHRWHVFNYKNMRTQRCVHAFTYVRVQLCVLACMCTHPSVRTCSLALTEVHVPLSPA